MKRIFIATSSFAQDSDEPLEMFNKYGYDVSMNKSNRKMNNDEITKNIKECEGVIAGTEEYSKSLLDQATNLKVISRLGVGMDNIDLEYAKKLRIKVYKTKTNPSLAVSELTLSLILDILRKVSLHDSRLKAGIWQKTMGSLLSGKTLGIIGLGNIGKQLVRLTMGFDLTYLAHDMNVDEDFAVKNNVKYCELDELLAQSDILSIHLNLTYDTKNLINFDAFRKMKPGAILINTSRGGVINEKSLIQALDSKLIAGAGLDVFQKEPYSGSLLEYENVVTTPHIGAYARELRMQMELEAAENLISGLVNEGI